MDLFDLTGKKAFITGKIGLLAPIWKETLEDAGVASKIGRVLLYW